MILRRRIDSRSGRHGRLRGRFFPRTIQVWDRLTQISTALKMSQSDNNLNCSREGGSTPLTGSLSSGNVSLCRYLRNLAADMDNTGKKAALLNAADEIQHLENEVARWKNNIIPFLAVHAGSYGSDHYGEGCMHYTHYDMLAEAGGRMDDFKRSGEPSSENANCPSVDAKEKPMP